MQLFIETILGSAAFYGLLTATSWGLSERIFLGAGFILIVFIFQFRALIADEQSRLNIQILNMGFSDQELKRSFPSDLPILLHHYELERRSVLYTRIASLLGSYALWFFIAWIVQVNLERLS